MKEIKSKGFYTKPLGFMYTRTNEVSDIEEQVRIYSALGTFRGEVGILLIDTNQWMPTSTHPLDNIDDITTFLDSHISIYP